jgi:hypothetical protein
VMTRLEANAALNAHGSQPTKFELDRQCAGRSSLGRAIVEFSSGSRQTRVQSRHSFIALFVRRCWRLSYAASKHERRARTRQ